MNSLSLWESRALARRGPIRFANDERSPKQQRALSGRYRVRLSRGESKVKIDVAYSTSAQSRGSVSDSAINRAPSND